MGTVLDLALARGLRPRAAPALPAACKGAACPAFAICQGRCAEKREAKAEARLATYLGAGGTPAVPSPNPSAA
jgi:hypothetical protein